MSTINTNLQAMNTAMTLNRDQGLYGQTLDKLSSGSNILSPGDNPAGLATSDSLGADNDRLSAASTNVQDALAYTQTADGNLSVMGGILTRMSELATETQDPTKNSSDIANYEQEFASLQDQLRSMIGGSTSGIGGGGVAAPSGTFNGSELFGSTSSGGVTFDVGDTAAQQMTIPDINLQSGAMLGMIQQDSSGAYTMNATGSDAGSALDDALQQVAAGRATLGAAESRLNLSASSLQVEQQNIASAVSGLSDVDMAQESTQLAKYNILMQSGAAMLAQANQAPQSVLKLLQHG
jgi:flagellin